MDLVVGETIRVGDVGVRLEGGVRQASASRGEPQLTLRGTRGTADVTNLLTSEHFRISGAVDLEVVPPTLGASRGGPGADAPSRIVFEAPVLADDEAAQVALVDDGGELRWLLPGDDPRQFVLDVEEVPSGDRGFFGTAVRKAVKFLAVKAAKPLAGKAIEYSVGVVEQNVRPPRLRTFESDTFRIDDVGEPPIDSFVGEPSLLFLHGTNSKTSTAFGRLPTDWVSELHKRYGGRVFAFDHPTISVGPADNADDFVRRLGDAVSADTPITLDIVAHSRGGLVARELAERPRPGVHVRSVTFVATPNLGTPIASAEHLGSFVDVLTNLAAVVPDNPVTDALQVIFELVKDIALDIGLDSLPGIRAMTPDGPYLRELNEAPRPEGLVYRAIAADFEPLNTAGTLSKLRDRMTDKVFGGAMNDLVVPTRSVYLTSGEFTVDVRRRLVLDSTRSISHSTFWTESDVLSRLDTWLDGAQKWPPPTPVGDPATADPQADVESNMEHGDSDGVAAAMKAVNDLPNTFSKAIEQIAGGPVRQPTPPSDKPDGDVVLLPGIMGSLIETQDGLVWIDAWKLMRGRFTSLALDDAADSGRAAGLNMTYAPLASRLSARWRVHLFPFDWRRDIRESADRLHEFIRTRVMADKKTPVHLVAHSMGGLVARSFIQRHRPTWNEMADAGGDFEKGGRLVMLGTPNRGSYAIPLALAGDDMLVKGLAAVDLRNDRDRLKRVIATFPGMYQMLPAPSLEIDDDHLQLFDTSAWADASPNADLLRDAREFQDELAKKHRGADAERMVYVAGDKHDTPGRIVIESGRHSFGITSEGDGRVLHSSGALDGVATYYTRASHGALASDENVLAAIDRLLTTGTPGDADGFSTSRFPRRGAEVDGPTATIPAGDVDPEPMVLATRGSGASLRSADAAVVMAESISGYVAQPDGARTLGTARGPRISVTHASLEQARHPVIVGHYHGIPPEGAERFLDLRLDRALTRRFDADEYPGDPGEVLFVEGTSPRPPGGIVIGLGDFGEITRAKLVKSVRSAVVERTLAANESGARGPVGVSSVLVGSPGDYDLTLGVAINAIVEGFARAAIDLEKLPGGLEVQLTELEIIELYEGRAILAAQRLGSAVAALPVEVSSVIRLDVETQLEQRRGGRPGVPTADNSGAWPRFLIERHLPPCPPPSADDDDGDDDDATDPGADDDGPPTGTKADKKAKKKRPEPYPCGDGAETPLPTLPELRFTQLGRGAQVDELSVRFDAEKVDALIERAIGDPRAVDESFALYEMLFPHEHKLELDDTDNLHLLVDEDSAYVPWELLYGRGDGRSGRALALRTGMLRQLRPADGGLRVRRTWRRPEGLRALVIGDPPTNDYGRLPGAREEAKLVRDLLQRRGYEVDALIFDDDDKNGEDVWTRIQAALYRHPYRIIHFAAHGEVDDHRPERSGLLVGGDMRLTALDIQQMSATPDLVFVNACHTARTGTGLGAARDATRVDQIASNFALQLMRNGVKAVIAAGWAVDDAAALSFARVTYEQLLSGHHYGQAVLRGRRAADDRRSNTWGAYQCYGDPSFRLSRPTGGNDDPPPVSDKDLVDRLVALRQRASEAPSTDGRRSVHGWVVEIAAREVPNFGSTTVYEALGAAYAELGCYADAVWAYGEAEKKDRGVGRMTLQALEQLANMQVRLAAELRRTGEPVIERIHEPPDSPGVLFRTAERRLNQLIRFGPTAERLGLRGSLHKKRAATMEERSLRGSAEQSRDAYRAGFALVLQRECSRERKRPLAAYTACNWVQMSRIVEPQNRLDLQGLVLELLEYEQQGDVRPLADDETLMNLLTDAVESDGTTVPAALRRAVDERAPSRHPVEEKRAGSDPAVDFWAEAGRGDVALTRMIFDQTSRNADVSPSIAASYYLAAFTNRSSARERDSVLDHLDDLVGIMKKEGHAALAHVQDLADMLRAEVERFEMRES